MKNKNGWGIKSEREERRKEKAKGTKGQVDPVGQTSHLVCFAVHDSPTSLALILCRTLLVRSRLRAGSFSNPVTAL